MHCVKVIDFEGRTICHILRFMFKDFFSPFPTENKNDLATKTIPQAD